MSMMYGISHQHTADKAEEEEEESMYSKSTPY